MGRPTGRGPHALLDARERPVYSCALVFERRSKIVCTIGPASDSREALERLIRAGMDVARLNFSHGSHEEHARRLDTLRLAATACKKPIAALQDLCGPKIRTGSFARGAYVLPPSGEVALVETKTKGVLAEEDTIPILYEGLAEDVQPGDAILIDDGRVGLRVRRIEAGRVVCEIVQTGTVRDQAGVHLPSRSVRISTLTEKDKADLSFGLSLGIDYVALSFVRKSEDIRHVREICEAWGRPTPIVAKIETPAAVDDLEGIIASADAIMVARGDLGVEVPLERVPVLQKRILQQAGGAGVISITATQMLESMVEQPRPTRAEASDVANAIFDGTDAVMLSAETASGRYPLRAVAVMDRIIREAERSGLQRPASAPEPPAGPGREVRAVAHAAVDAAREWAARAVVVYTQTGETARILSKLRPPCPIFALTPTEAARRRMALCWGVLPLAMRFSRSTDRMLRDGDRVLLSAGLLGRSARVIVVSGTSPQAGATNLMKLHRLGERR